MSLLEKNDQNTNVAKIFPRTRKLAYAIGGNNSPVFTHLNQDNQDIIELEDGTLIKVGEHGKFHVVHAESEKRRREIEVMLQPKYYSFTSTLQDQHPPSPEQQVTS